MSTESQYPVTREKGGAASCTATFTNEQFAQAEEQAVRTLGKDVTIDGFRAGTAPTEKIKEKLNPEEVLNQTIRNLLPEVMETVIQENQLQPIIPPKVDVESMEPLTVKVTFFEKPEVELKGADKLSVQPEEPKVEDKDVERLMDYVRKQHQTSAKKEGPAENGDRVTIDFWGETLDGQEIENIRTTGHQVVLGSNVLLPGFEDELIGLQAGDKKDFTLTFPEKHQAEELRNKPVSFHVTVTEVEKVDMPELTDEFVQQNLQMDSVDAFKQQVRESMVQQEQQAARKKHEEEALEQIRAATKVDLAPELIDDEFRALLEDLQKHLQQQNVSFKDWLEQNGKSPEEAEKELREQAEKRLTLRLGLAKLVEERDVQISDEEMQAAIESFLQPMSDNDRAEAEKAYQKGEQAYEQLKWQKKVEKVLDDIIQ